MRTTLLKRAMPVRLLPPGMNPYQFYFYFICCIAFTPLQGQNLTIPAERVFDWPQAGLKSAIPLASVVYNVLDYDIIGDGVTPNDDAFSTLINSATDEGFVEFYFPAGDYLFTQAIELRSNISINGKISETRLVFQQTDGQHSMIANGTLSGISSSLSISTNRSTNYILVDSASLFHAGELIRISEQDDALITSSWAAGSTGQLNYISDIKGDTIVFEHKLRRIFTTVNNAKIEKINPLENISISNLKIERKDPTANQTSNIYFNYTVNSSISCIESYRCNFAHVDIRNSSNIEVTGSYFHEGHNYGGGGKAYGVMLHFATGECLITNSIFRKLRHSMILQAGANGNVFAYNYSYEPYWTGTFLPPNSAGDLVLHGNYPYANLFEGNVGQNIVIDDSHGSNGPYNTFLRNRAENYGLFMNFNPASNQQTFIGNEISNPNRGLYFIQGSDHIEIANNVLNVMTPDMDQELELKSLAFDSPPLFFTEGQIWPSIGYPNSLAEGQIPAQARLHLEQWTACSPPAEITTNTINLSSTKKKVAVSPNPANDFFQLAHSTTANVRKVQIFNVQGVLIHSYEAAPNYNINDLNSGVYWIEVEFDDKTSQVMKLLKR